MNDDTRHHNHSEGSHDRTATHQRVMHAHTTEHPAASRWATLSVFVLGLAAVIWIVVRLLPKPDRASYPCMRVAVSLASGWMVQVGILVLSLFSFHSARRLLRETRYRAAVVLGAGALLLPLFISTDARTDETAFPTAVVTANAPVGVAKGDFPGRVVWVHDPTATNKNCQPSLWGHGWFMSENSNQAAIDTMLSAGLKKLTEQKSDSAAWNSIFVYHNQTRGKGPVGYLPGERIFIKTNATSAWYGNINPSDLAKVNNSYYGISETSPQIVLSMLRQLVNVVKVQQSDIYVGDPLKHIYKHAYDLWYPEFQNVHYLDHDGWGGREKVVKSQTAVIQYSDGGKVLHTSTGVPALNDTLYTIFETAEYMINIPMLKGHKYAGMTAFAKNHFGSHTRADASHLHNGLVNPPDSNRFGYGLYRVQVDLMGHRLLGGKNLFFLMDALWATDMELSPPLKWDMPPFNRHWMSSIFLSQDNVAIESVGYDFLRAEFTSGKVPAESTFVQMPGVDDYLRQAADSANWPKGVVYDPDKSGTPIASLGTNENWNNPTDRQYSRNLGRSEGIELIQIDRNVTSVWESSPTVKSFTLYPGYPNPFNPGTTISYDISEPGHVTLTVYDIRGQLVERLVSGQQVPGRYTVRFDGTRLASGMYLCRLQAGTSAQTQRLLLIR